MGLKMRGVLGLSVFNVLIVGVIAIIFVWGYNTWLAGSQVAGMTLGRA
jgi:hypothetical protein